MESKQISSAQIWRMAINEKTLDAQATDRLKSLERENQNLRKVFDLAKNAVTPKGSAYWN